MSSMYETIGRYEPSYLLADPVGVQKTAIPCEPGNGVVERGTIMYRKENGMFAPAEAANATKDTYLTVLDETVDTSAVTGVAEDAVAYEHGRLIAGRVTLKDGGEVTSAIALALRQQGITLHQLSGAAPVFENGENA